MTKSGFITMSRQCRIDGFCAHFVSGQSFQRYAPSIRFEIIADVEYPETFYERAKNLNTPQYMKSYLGKYGYHTYNGLEEFVRCDSNFECFYHEPSAQVVNIFLYDRMALNACEYADQKGLHVPEDFGILSLENNPEFYHHQISCCIPNWENIGYIMAHSLIGDIQVEKSRKGFIRMPALFLDRGSC